MCMKTSLVWSAQALMRRDAGDQLISSRSTRCTPIMIERVARTSSPAQRCRAVRRAGVRRGALHADLVSLDARRPGPERAAYSQHVPSRLLHAVPQSRRPHSAWVARTSLFLCVLLMPGTSILL